VVDRLVLICSRVVPLDTSFSFVHALDFALLPFSADTPPSSLATTLPLATRMPAFVFVSFSPHARSKWYRWDIHLGLDESLLVSFISHYHCSYCLAKPVLHYRMGLWWDFLSDRLLKGRRGNILGHGLHVLDGYNLLGLIMILVLERSSSHELSGRYDGCDGRLNVLAGFWDGFTRWYDDGLWECGCNFSFVLLLGILNRLIPIYCSFYTIQH
jgi:hypothetical protein